VRGGEKGAQEESRLLHRVFVFPDFRASIIRSLIPFPLKLYAVTPERLTIGAYRGSGAQKSSTLFWAAARLFKHERPSLRLAGVDDWSQALLPQAFPINLASFRPGTSRARAKPQYSGMTL